MRIIARDSALQRGAQKKATIHVTIHVNMVIHIPKLRDRLFKTF